MFHFMKHSDKTEKPRFGKFWGKIIDLLAMQPRFPTTRSMYWTKLISTYIATSPSSKTDFQGTTKAQVGYQQENIRTISDFTASLYGFMLSSLLCNNATFLSCCTSSLDDPIHG